MKTLCDALKKFISKASSNLSKLKAFFLQCSFFLAVYIAMSLFLPVLSLSLRDLPDFRDPQAVSVSFFNLKYNFILCFEFQIKKSKLEICVQSTCNCSVRHVTGMVRIT